jgi:hypothetical protein
MTMSEDAFVRDDATAVGHTFTSVAHWLRYVGNSAKTVPARDNRPQSRTRPALTAP